jgi:hypothetical protein
MRLDDSRESANLRNMKKSARERTRISDLAEVCLINHFELLEALKSELGISY